jgi:hypothetical protein
MALNTTSAKLNRMLDLLGELREVEPWTVADRQQAGTTHEAVEGLQQEVEELKGQIVAMQGALTQLTAQTGRMCTLMNALAAARNLDINAKETPRVVKEAVSLAMWHIMLLRAPIEPQVAADDDAEAQAAAGGAVAADGGGGAGAAAAAADDPVNQFHASALAFTADSVTDIDEINDVLGDVDGLPTEIVDQVLDDCPTSIIWAPHFCLAMQVPSYSSRSGLSTLAGTLRSALRKVMEVGVPLIHFVSPVSFVIIPACCTSHRRKR